MAQTGPRAQWTPGRTHHQSKGSCLYLSGRPQVPTSLGPLAHSLGEATGVSWVALPHPPRSRLPAPGRAAERLPGGGGPRAAAASGGPARPRPLGPPPQPCAPGSGSRPRCCGVCSRRRRRWQRERPWRRAPRPAREPRAGAAQVRAAPPHLSTATPSSSPSFLPADPHVSPLRCSHLPLLNLPPSVPPLTRARSPSSPLSLLPPAASSRQFFP